MIELDYICKTWGFKGRRVMDSEEIKKLEYFAYVSPVTGGDNINRFKDRLTQQLLSGFLVAMDIVDFKVVNSTCGVKRGDDVLKAIWECLKNILDENDIACHIYADRFLVFSPGDDKNRLIDKFDKITDALKQMSLDMDVPLLTPCFGVSVWQNGDSVEASYGYASMAKKKIRNKRDINYSFYSQADSDRIMQEKIFEEDFEPAIKNKEFEIWYQPKCNSADGGLVGAEALIRWRRNGEVLPPDSFIHIFERNGMIRHLDEYVFRSVCEQQKKWEKEGKKLVPISTNLSAVSLYFPNVVEQYKSIVKELDVSCKFVPIEITESVIIENSEIKRLTDEFFKEGFSLHLDDFGTRCSSLSILNQLHFNTLKIDKSLVDCIGNYGGDKLLEHTIAFAKDLGMHVTAEGVENNSQVKFLSELNCDSIQGYYYSKSLTTGDFEKVLSDEKLLHYGETSNQYLDLSSKNSYLFKSVLNETVKKAIEYAKKNNKTLVTNPFVTSESIYLDKKLFEDMMRNYFEFVIDQVKESECAIFTCFRRAVADANYVSYNFVLHGINTFFSDVEMEKAMEASDKYRNADRIAKEMGGSVIAKCAEGKNLQITIRMPFKQVRKSSNPFSSLQKVIKREILSQLRGKRVLFAEDDELSRFLTTEMLNSAGFEVEAVTNGNDVIDALNVHAPGHYAFILMDIVMPGMDGFETTKKIRSSHRSDLKKIPIVALTAYVLDEEKKKSIECGMNGHIGKPLDLGELSKVLGTCMIE